MKAKMDLQTLSKRIIEDDEAKKITGGGTASCYTCDCETWSGTEAASTVFSAAEATATF